jgi:hypothetical protein
VKRLTREVGLVLADCCAGVGEEYAFATTGVPYSAPEAGCQISGRSWVEMDEAAVKVVPLSGQFDVASGGSHCLEGRDCATSPFSASRPWGKNCAIALPNRITIGAADPRALQNSVLATD